MRPVKKAKKREEQRGEIATPLDPKVARREASKIENALIDAEEVAEARYEYAREIFLMQDEPTRNAITMMVEKMHALAGNSPVVNYNGRPVQAEEERLEKLRGRILNWCAVRLFVACAVWDIQIANFKLPEDKCAKCAKPVKEK